MGLLDVVGSGLGVGNIFESKTEDRGFQEIPLTDIQKQAEEFLASLFKGAAPLQKVAGLSELEKQAVVLASQFVKAPL